MGSHTVAYYMNTGQREDQEDCIFVHGKIIQENRSFMPYIEKIEDRVIVLAVCDGLGGLSHGKWASRFVCNKLKERLSDIESHNASVPQILTNIQKQMETQDMKNAGSTIAGVIIEDSKVTIFNAGDSRVYKITGNEISRLSHDHSLVQQQIDRGYISQEESSAHPYRHVITFGMGDVFRDLWINNNQQIYLTENILSQNDCYLICSDGMYDIFDDKEILGMLSPAPIDKLTEIIRHITVKMKDNVSFILIGKA